MQKERTGFVYCIENTVNGKKYVGQTKQRISARFYQHKYLLRLNRHLNQHLQSSWNKHGEENFVFCVLAKCPVADLNELEKEYIAKTGSYENGYNMNMGGSEQAELKPEVREKMILAKTSHPVYQLTLRGEAIKLWKSAHEAARELNLSQSGLWSCLNNGYLNDSSKRRTCGGFLWVYKENLDSFSVGDADYSKHQAKAICQYDCDMKLVKEWKNAKEPALEGFKNSSILRACQGISMRYKGFYWRYADGSSKVKTENKKHPRQRAVSQYTMQGEHVRDYVSARQAASQGFDPGHVLNCCDGEKKFHKGFIFLFSDQKENLRDRDFSPNINPNQKAVRQYDKDMNFIRRYGSISEAVQNGFDSSSIRGCCSGAFIQHRGFRWRYDEEDNENGGTEHSDDWGRPGSRKKIVQVGENNEIVKTWDSVKETANQGFKPSGVSACLTGVQKTHRGFEWRYADTQRQ